MSAKKDLFQTYIKKAVSDQRLAGVCTDGVETLATDGRTVLWYKDPLYTSLVPQLAPDHQANILHTIKHSMDTETLASITVSGKLLKLMADTINHNKPTFVTLHIRKYGKGAALVAGTRDTGMVVLSTNKAFGGEITKDDAPFLFWGMDDVEDTSDVSL